MKSWTRKEEEQLASKTRDARVIAAVACPVCKAGPGDGCRNPVPHQPWRGPVDRRPQPVRPHSARRAAWVASKGRGQAANAPLCAVHGRVMICPACIGSRGGKATTPEKVAASRRNAALATAARLAKRGAADG